MPLQPTTNSGIAATSASFSFSFPSTPHFTAIAEQAGIDYRWNIAGKRPLNILQTIGNGCAFLDYDNDGNLDILLVGPHLALYRGDGTGHFTDMTRETGLSDLSGKLSNNFLGCAVGDYDNDGYPDIYLSGFRTGILLHNERGKRFTDVTRQAGIEAQPWGTSCAWAETVPGSGHLDLFIANYARFGPEPAYQQLCESRGILTSCGPRYYKPLRGAFYRNIGNGRFVRADLALNLNSTNGRGLGAAFAPLHASDTSAQPQPLYPSLTIANDEMYGDLLDPIYPIDRMGTGPTPGQTAKTGKTGKTGRQNHPSRYTNIATAAGVAGDRDGNIHGGMGADWGDYDNDGRFDLFVTTFQGEVKSLYHNDGEQIFSDATYLTGIAPIAISSVAFGCKMFDFDNDGYLDLILTNGHVQDNITQIDASTTYRQLSYLLHNRGGLPISTPPTSQTSQTSYPASQGSKNTVGTQQPRITFEDVSGRAGADLQRPIVGRGLAIGDFDNDGREDVLIVDSEGSPLLLHNESGSTGHWLGVRLEGDRSNRDGIGAILTASVNGHLLTRLCHTDGSYLSASDRRVHFGLGTVARMETLTIHWPDGQIDTLHDLPVDRYITVREGKGIDKRIDKRINTVINIQKYIQKDIIEGAVAP